MTLPDINAMLLLKLLRQQFGEKVVEVVSAEPVVTVTRQNLGDVAFYRHHGNIEGAATQVVDQRRVTRTVGESIREACGGRFIQNSHDFKPGQRACFASGATLCVGEIGRYRDDRFFRALPQRHGRPTGQFTQDDGGDLGRRKSPVAQRHRLIRAHFAFDTSYAAFGIVGLLISCRLPDQQFTRRRYADARRQDPLVARPEHLHPPVHERRYLGIRRP